MVRTKKKGKQSASRAGKALKSSFDVIEKESPKLNASIQNSVNKHRNLWVLIIFLILLGVFLYFTKSLFVVALVNGRPITRLSLIQQLERTGGGTALDSLVNRMLIEQEARKNNVSVSKDEIQSELDKVKQDLEAQGMSLDAALSAQGMTLVDFEESLRMKRTVEKILKDSIQVTDEDVIKYFEENKEQYGKDATIEELKPAIRAELESIKLSTEFQNWYGKLKSESDIKYFVDF